MGVIGLKSLICKRRFKLKYMPKLAMILVLSIISQCFIVTEVSKALVTSSLTGVILNNDIQISLKWTDNLTDEKQYIVERKTDAGSFETRGWSSANTTSYVDIFDLGHTYTYRVKVTDSTNTTYVYTDEIVFRPGEVQRPESLTLTPVTTEQNGLQIDIKWTYANQKAYNTIVERRAENDTNWYQIAKVGIGQNTYSDKSIAPGIRYYYRVRAYATDSITTTAYPDDSGSSAYSLLYKPTELYGFALSQYKVQLSWKDNSVETAFIIERKSPDEGLFKELAVVPQNTNSYIDEDPKLVPNKTYVYRVKAVTGNTASEYSDSIYITTTYLKSPATLTSSCTDGKTIKLDWIDLTDTETGFEIWRKVGTSTPWELVETMGRNAITFTDLSVSMENTYTYKIRAKINDNTVYSDFSNETTVWSATITAPTDLSYSAVSKNEIRLTWQDTSNIEAGFRVERKLGLGGDWYTIAFLEPNTITYNDKWINNTDTFYYRIKVYDRSNSVNYSNELMVSLKAPEAPSNLKAETLSSTEVKLTWKDNSLNESQFVIEALQYFNFLEIGRVDANVTSYTCKNLVSDKPISFRVRAVNGTNLSNYSNEVVANTKAVVTYTDLGTVSWAAPAINNLATRGVFDAKTGTKFYPNQKITRGEFCALLMRSLGLTKVSAGSYKDVNSRTKYYKEIMSAAKFGIISPDKYNKLYPNNAITREQAGVMITLAMKAKGTPLPQADSSILKQFADYKTISSTSANKIAAVCGAGILNGTTKNNRTYLNLSGTVTRAEAAVMLYGAINLN